MKRNVIGFVLAVFVVCTALAYGDDAARAETPQHKSVVAGERYRKSGLHRFFFGAEYRDLWTTPLTLEVLDLATYAGGLTPVRTLGHGQTKALALKGADGKSYTFRGLIKDPSGLLPVELQQTVARSVVVDQMASQHPAGHVIVPGLLEATGVLHTTPRLVVMPDDPALGEFRPLFAGVVGDLELWGGSPGFGGSSETIDGEEMWKRLRQSPEVRADSRAYLKARLFDQLIGDWDRHRDQWRWAKVPGKARWQPIPEDRDQAFVRFEGAVIAVLRPQLPLLADFGPGYSSLDGLTFDGWDVDKRILADLEKPVWDEVARELQSELTDSVIEAAAARMPPEYFPLDGARLIAGLKARRSTLPRQADRFYRFINHDVDVFGTDQGEHVVAHRHSNGDLELTIRAASGGAEAEPYFRRRIEAAVTHEVRLYLHGGADTVVVTGGRHGGPQLRVVADGPDVVDDAKAGGTRVSASASDARVIEGPGTHWDRRPYTQPPLNKSGAWIPPRDWGRKSGPLFLLSFGSDYGVLIGGALNTTGYGFRKDPWSDQQSLRVLYATSEKAFRGTYTGEFRFENSKLRVALYGLASGVEISRFFGIGNDTPLEGDKNLYKLEQDRLHFEPALVYAVTPRFELALDGIVKRNHTEPRANPVLNGAPFYGEGVFLELGVATRFRYDSTERLALPRNAVLASGAAAFYPAAADVTKAFGRVHSQVKVFLSVPGELGPTLALRAGGERAFGTYPFFESAFIGGKTPFNPLEPGGVSSVRGLPPQRYAGDASAFGGGDLYVPLTRAKVFVPGQLGVLGFFDAGRVFVTGEKSTLWHHGFGGGIYFMTPGRHNLVSASLGRSENLTSFYVRAGFAF